MPKDLLTNPAGEMGAGFALPAVKQGACKMLHGLSNEIIMCYI